MKQKENNLIDENIAIERESEKEKISNINKPKQRNLI